MTGCLTMSPQTYTHYMDECLSIYPSPNLPASLHLRRARARPCGRGSPPGRSSCRDFIFIIIIITARTAALHRLPTHTECPSIHTHTPSRLRSLGLESVTHTHTHPHLHVPGADAHARPLELLQRGHPGEPRAHVADGRVVRLDRPLVVCFCVCF